MTGSRGSRAPKWILWEAVQNFSNVSPLPKSSTLSNRLVVAALADWRRRGRPKTMRTTINNIISRKDMSGGDAHDVGNKNHGEAKEKLV